MGNRWLTRLACLFAALVIVISIGCSAEKVQRRQEVVRTDLKYMADDIDWFFGLDEPSILHEESFPPYD